ncbi:MAG: hypothetical protein Q9219_007034 [cf. Caloplaca sp. 3 TL-2023]
MALHSVAIAKASLAAHLMRPEPKSLARNEITHFHRLLDALLLQGSAINIQLCKEWLINNVSSSTARTETVGKYLVTLSASLSASVGGSFDQDAPSIASRRRRLNILYLLHDFLHHIKFHSISPLESPAFSSQTFQTSVMQLVALTSAQDPAKHAQHFRRLHGIIDIWAEDSYYPSASIAALREAVANEPKRSDVSQQENVSMERLGSVENAGENGSRRDAPYIMPSSHGDLSTPFYDLPASNLMPCIVPDSLSPINPQAVKPMLLPAGPANEIVVHAIKVFLQDADLIYGIGQAEIVDVDEMGQPAISNNSSGDFSAGEGYYGWSKTFYGERHGQERDRIRLLMYQLQKIVMQVVSRTWMDLRKLHHPGQTSSQKVSAALIRYPFLRLDLQIIVARG